MGMTSVNERKRAYQEYQAAIFNRSPVAAREAYNNATIKRANDLFAKAEELKERAKIIHATRIEMFERNKFLAKLF